MAYFVKVKDGWVNLDAVARVVVMEDNSGQPERVLIYFQGQADPVAADDPVAAKTFMARVSEGVRRQEGR
jgi:hypothetical protein